MIMTSARHKHWSNTGSKGVTTDGRLYASTTTIHTWLSTRYHDINKVLMLRIACGNSAPALTVKYFILLFFRSTVGARDITLQYDWDGSQFILGCITDPSSWDLYARHYSWKGWLTADIWDAQNNTKEVKRVDDNLRSSFWTSRSMTRSMPSIGN
jgi:hypothetical protein